MASDESAQPLLYVVDDDFELRATLEQYLRRHDFDTIGFSTADEMLRRLPRRRPHLVILDVMMPGTGGLEALRSLRQDGDDLPVILLTARSDIEDRIAGLSMGADDYLGKPFSVRELLARVRSVLKRAGAPRVHAPALGKPIDFGPFVLDPKRRTLEKNGDAVDMRAADFALLHVLASHPFTSLSRERLVEMTSTRVSEKSERSIDAQIVRLRGLIEADPGMPRILQTVRGVGYVFVPP